MVTIIMYTESRYQNCFGKRTGM